jgi:hypothetical protein
MLSVELVVWLADAEICGAAHGSKAKGRKEGLAQRELV